MTGPFLEASAEPLDVFTCGWLRVGVGLTPVDALSLALVPKNGPAPPQLGGPPTGRLEVGEPHGDRRFTPEGLFLPLLTSFPQLLLFFSPWVAFVFIQSFLL